MYLMFTRDYCPWCDKAKELLGDNARVLNITDFPEGRDMVRQVWGSVPYIIDLDSTFKGGYNELVEKIGAIPDVLCK